MYFNHTFDVCNIVGIDHIHCENIMKTYLFKIINCGCCSNCSKFKNCWRGDFTEMYTHIKQTWIFKNRFWIFHFAFLGLLDFQNLTFAWLIELSHVKHTSLYKLLLTTASWRLHYSQLHFNPTAITTANICQRHSVNVWMARMHIIILMIDQNSKEIWNFWNNTMFCWRCKYCYKMMKRKLWQVTSKWL